MGAPVAPTLTSLVTEALNKAEYSNPSNALITRAENQWMEEIKNDIYTLEKRLKSLYTTAYAATVNGVHRYAYPTDFGEDLNITLLDGTNTGTVQSATASTIGLGSNTLTSDYLIGKYVLDTTNPACSQMTAYDSNTFISSVTPDFTSTPTNGDNYLIIENYYELTPLSVPEIDNVVAPTFRTRPYWFASIGNATTGEIILYNTPDAVYGLQLRYYANLMTVDLAGTLMSTIYQKWRNIFIQGVYARALASKNDTRVQAEMQKYYDYIKAMVAYEKDTDNFKAGDYVEPAFCVGRR